ncbi:MAG: hypothetical protein IT487_17765 [Chromatiaceae bacterium]|nr:hypothetical protein [Chromatiaceae bacterium]
MPRPHHPARHPAQPGRGAALGGKLGGFLGRKGDGQPGSMVVWRVFEALALITATFRFFHPQLPAGP